jgi:hypothetical protein
LLLFSRLDAFGHEPLVEAAGLFEGFALRFISVSLEVAERSEPSMIFCRPLRAAWGIWSDCRPLGPILFPPRGD